MAGGQAMIGRVDEWGRLSHVLQATAAARAGVVLVDGPPGIGKTTLVRHLVAVSGARVVSVSGDEAEVGLDGGRAEQVLRQAGGAPLRTACDPLARRAPHGAREGGRVHPWRDLTATSVASRRALRLPGAHACAPWVTAGGGPRHMARPTWRAARGGPG